MIQDETSQIRIGHVEKVFLVKILKIKNFSISMIRRVLLSLANADPNANDSQFFITTVPTPYLDGKHILFAQVIKRLGVARMFKSKEVVKNLPNCVLLQNVEKRKKEVTGECSPKMGLMMVIQISLGMQI
ncbi:rCG41611 [Rattus norvegicus]|uniref:Peptidyl-prolyl cis-trans isomerase n=1 Tax=Rattus norvegicus TaxID=10116 RepID=A6IHC1_RAT|nr:rCG41611 [Rattus norvegicus]